MWRVHPQFELAPGMLLRLEPPRSGEGTGSPESAHCRRQPTG
jgi:hypothetical protein